MNELIVIKCSEPIYGSELEIFINADKEELEVELNGRHPGSYFIFPTWCSAFHASPENSYNHYIWLKEYNPLDSNDIATLGHEIIHYCSSTLYKAGISLSKDNDEVLTHLFHYTFNKVLWDLGKIQKQINKKTKK